MTDLKVKHDSFDSYFRSPFGAVPQEKTINLRLKIKEKDPENVFLFLKKDKLGIEKEYMMEKKNSENL